MAALGAHHYPGRSVGTWQAAHCPGRSRGKLEGGRGPGRAGGQSGVAKGRGLFLWLPLGPLLGWCPFLVAHVVDAQKI